MKIRLSKTRMARLHLLSNELHRASKRLDQLIETGIVANHNAREEFLSLRKVSEVLSDELKILLGDGIRAAERHEAKEALSLLKDIKVVHPEWVMINKVIYRVTWTETLARVFLYNVNCRKGHATDFSFPVAEEAICTSAWKQIDKPTDGHAPFYALALETPEWIFRTTTGKVCRLEWTSTIVRLWSDYSQSMEYCIFLPTSEAKKFLDNQVWLSTSKPIDSYPPNYGLTGADYE